MRKWHYGTLAGLSSLSLVLAGCGGDSATSTSPGSTTTGAANSTVSAGASASDTASASAGASDTAGAGGAASESAATGGAAEKAEGKKVGVILPDSKSSARWESADRKFLKAAFDKAGIQSDIQNAQGDKSNFQTIADQMITSGVDVLMIVNLDSGTGKAVLDKAKAAGVATIDYDRLTLGGSASYYVSFDNVEVGKLQGQGLAKCLADKKVTKGNIVYLNGSPTDNNATLFKQGYDSVLSKLNQYKKVADQSVPDWDNAQAATIFEQMLTSNKDIDGVLAANDGLGGAAISILKKNGLNGKVPVTGQDATVEGLQAILTGDQCMTVYKAIKKEADAAAALAVSLANGSEARTTGTVKDTEAGRNVPSVLVKPVSVFAPNVKDVVADGFVSKAELCKGAVAAACTKGGIS